MFTDSDLSFRLTLRRPRTPAGRTGWLNTKLARRSAVPAAGAERPKNTCGSPMRRYGVRNRLRLMASLCLPPGRAPGRKSAANTVLGRNGSRGRKRQSPVAGPLEFAPHGECKVHILRGIQAVLLGLVHHFFAEGERRVQLRVNSVTIALGLRVGLLLGGFFGVEKSSQ